MMETTLTIISRTLFSSDAEHLTDVVRRGVEGYQAEVRPTLADFLGVPQWLARRGAGAFASRQETICTARAQSLDTRDLPPHRAKCDTPLMLKIAPRPS